VAQTCIEPKAALGLWPLLLGACLYVMLEMLVARRRLAPRPHAGGWSRIVTGHVAGMAVCGALGMASAILSVQAWHYHSTPALLGYVVPIGGTATAAVCVGGVVRAGMGRLWLLAAILAGVGAVSAATAFVVGEIVLAD
jgi:hypothetical protein